MLDNFVFPTLTINDQHSLQQLAFGKYIGPRTFFAGECVFVSAVLFSLEVGQQAMLSCHKVSARLMFMFWEESSILYLTKLLLILCWALLGIAQMLSKLASRLEVDALSPVFSRPLVATGGPVGRRVTPPSLVVVRPTLAATTETFCLDYHGGCGEAA